MASTTAAGSRGVALYRACLKAHRSNLPPQLKKLGNDYLRNEFKLHKKVEKVDVLSKFYKGWEDYLRTVSSQRGKFGRDLEADAQQSLSVEQRKKLDELREEARRVSPA